MTESMSKANCLECHPDLRGSTAHSTGLCTEHFGVALARNAGQSIDGVLELLRRMDERMTRMEGNMGDIRRAVMGGK